MATGQKRNAPLIRQAGQGLENFKFEVASELSINPEWKSGYWGDISARECGAVGGHMVRRMIAAAEQSLVNQSVANVQSTFWTNMGNAATSSASSLETASNLAGAGLAGAGLAGANLTGSSQTGANFAGSGYMGAGYLGNANANGAYNNVGTVGGGYTNAANLSADALAGLSTSFNKYNV